jgi:hypothetical protein
MVPRTRGDDDVTKNSGGGGAGGSREHDAVLVVAGLADLAFSGIGAVLRRGQELLGRSDLADLAQDGRDDVKARGRLALQRYVTLPESHMELIAQRVAARRGESDA